MTEAALFKLIARLEALPDRPPLPRVRSARALSDEAMAVIAAVGDEAVWEATRPRGALTRQEAAAELGVSEAAIGKAIRRHNARRRSLTVHTGSGKTTRA